MLGYLVPGTGGAEIQLSEGGGLPDESLEGIGGGEDSEGAEQAQSLVKLERRVDRLLVTAGSDAAQVQKYLQDRHAQMKARVKRDCDGCEAVCGPGTENTTCAF